MDHPGGVCRAKGPQHVDDHLTRAVFAERRVTELVAKRAAGEELHHDERTAAVLAGVVDRDHVRIGQTRRGSCFLFEAKPRFRL